MKDRPSRVKKMPKTPSRFKALIVRNKRLITLLAILALAVFVVGASKYSAYLGKFSDRDYAAIENAAESVMKSVGRGDVEEYKYCSYEAPEKYTNTRLYCSVEIATYISYESDHQAILTAKKLEGEVKKLGSTISDLSSIYERPFDTISGISVNLASPLPQRQCRFTIATNESAKDISSFLPKRAESNLIAILFDCSAQSREAYFPVTYRQGQ